MAEFPREVRVSLSRSAKAGLFAAESPDLPGLLTVGRTIEDLERQLPGDIRALIMAQYEIDVEVQFIEGVGPGGFLPLAEPRVAELREAA